jgi:hypothetical protein
MKCIMQKELGEEGVGNEACWTWLYCTLEGCLNLSAMATLDWIILYGGAFSIL